MNNYTNREIDLMFKEIKIILNDQNNVLSEIKTKVTFTNGRVRVLEKAMWLISGAVLIMSWLLANNFISCLGQCK